MRREEGLHCGKVQPTAHLVRASDSEALTSGSECAACFKLVLQRFAFGFGAFEHSIGITDRVGESSLESCGIWM